MITHESPSQKYAYWNFELVDAKTFGERHMQRMAQCMYEQEQYALFVGILTIPLHRIWAQSAIDYRNSPIASSSIPAINLNLLLICPGVLSYQLHVI